MMNLHDTPFFFAQIDHFSRRIYDNGMHFIHYHAYRFTDYMLLQLTTSVLWRLLHWLTLVLYVIISQVIGRFLRIKLPPDVVRLCPACMRIVKRRPFFQTKAKQLSLPAEA